MKKSELREMIKTLINEALTEDVAEETNELVGIVFKHGQDDFSLWTDFSLTEEEETAVMEILNNHVNEGGSVRGTKEEIIAEIQE